jgi:drug/metabolite transporter (DMT)-like permease
MKKNLGYKETHTDKMQKEYGGEIKGFLALSLAVIFFSTESVMASVIMSKGVDPLTLSVIKVTLGCIMVGLIMLFTKKSFRLERKDILGMMMFGFIAVSTMTSTFMIAIQLTNVGTAMILVYTAPAFTLILAALFLKERITRLKLMTVVLIMIGTVLVVVGYNLNAVDMNLLGVLTGLLAGLAYAIHGLLSRVYIKRYSPWTINFYILLFGALGLMIAKNPLALMAEGLPDMGSLIWILGQAMVVYVCAYTLFILGFRYLEAGVGAILTSVQPAVVVLIAAVFLHEKLYAVQTVGLVLMMLAMLAFSRSERN